jgi:hypothetical protein
MAVVIIYIEQDDMEVKVTATTGLLQVCTTEI